MTKKQLELCTKLAGYLKKPKKEYLVEIRTIMDSLSLSYERLISQSFLIALDDVVILTLQKVLNAYYTFQDYSLQEKCFYVLIHAIERSPTLINSSEQRFISLLQCFVMHLPQPDSDLIKIRSHPEELRQAIICCIQQLLQSVRREQISDTSIKAQASFFAYLISSLLHIAKVDRCKEVAENSIQTLSLSMDFISQDDLIAQYLPGISVGMWKCINQPNQSSKTVVAATRCLSKVIIYSVGDFACEHLICRSDYSLEFLRKMNASWKDREKSLVFNSNINHVSNNKDEFRSEIWLNDTRVNVDNILSLLFSSTIVRRDGNWRVRVAILELCSTIVLNCRFSLDNSFIRCFEELLVLLMDPIEEVSGGASRILSSLLEDFSKDEWIDRVPQFSERFMEHLSDLCVKCTKEQELVSLYLVQVLMGYLQLLQHKLRSSLDCSIQHIYAYLNRIVAFDALDIQLLTHEDCFSSRNMEGVESSLMVPSFHKRFLYFTEEETCSAMFQILQWFGTVITPEVYVDQAFQILNDLSSTTFRVETLYLLNTFLRSATPSKSRIMKAKQNLSKLKPYFEESENLDRRHDKIDLHLIGRVLEELLELEEWKNVNEMKDKKKQKSKRLILVNALECIGTCAELVAHLANSKNDDEDVATFLLHILLPVVEKLGIKDVAVEHAAHSTLQKIAFFSGYKSISELFELNMDYFVDGLCAKLRCLDLYPITPYVIDGILRHAIVSALPLMVEITQSLLRAVDAYQHTFHIEPLMLAVKHLMKSVTSLPQDVGSNQDSHLAKLACGKTREEMDLDEFINEIQMLTLEWTETDENDMNTKLTHHEDRDEPENEDDEMKLKGAIPIEFDEIKEDEEKSSPQVDIVVEVLNRCAYFMADSNPLACCRVLEIVSEGVQFLRYSRKQLLPLVHRLWPPLMYRLKVKNFAIRTNAIMLLGVLAKVTGEFIGDRFTENVWPVFRVILEESMLHEKSQQTRVTRQMLDLKMHSQEAQYDANADDEIDTEVDKSVQKSKRKTHHERLILATINCLADVSEHTNAVSLLVPDIVRVCVIFFDSSMPPFIQEATTNLFRGLAKLNADEVFVAAASILQLIPGPSPSDRFPAISEDNIKRFYLAFKGEKKMKFMNVKQNSVALMQTAVELERFYCRWPQLNNENI